MARLPLTWALSVEVAPAGPTKPLALNCAPASITGPLTVSRPPAAAPAAPGNRLPPACTSTVLLCAGVPMVPVPRSVPVPPITTLVVTWSVGASVTVPVTFWK